MIHDEFSFNVSFGKHPLGLGGIAESRRYVIATGTALLIGSGLMAGGSFLSSRSAKSSASRSRKLLAAMFAEEARRRTEALKLHENIVARWAPGSTGWDTGMGLVDRSVRKATAGAVQGLASSGLAGTTVKAGIGPRVEEQIGMPGRENVLGRYTAALTNQAQVVGQSPFATIPPGMISAMGGSGISTTGRMLSALSDLPYMLSLAGKIKDIPTAQGSQFYSQSGNSGNITVNAARGRY